MPGGFNTDVQCDGTTLHVQSEDRGRENPVLETLVYTGGQILHQEKSSWADLVDKEGGEPESHRRLERQHRDVVRRARHGEFLPTARHDGESAVDLETALVEELARGALRTLSVDFTRDGEGIDLRGRLAVSSGTDPVEGARLSARTVGRALAPSTVWAGTTDAAGAAEVEILALGAAGAVVFTVLAENAEARLRFDLDPVARSADAPPAGAVAGAVAGTGAAAPGLETPIAAAGPGPDPLESEATGIAEPVPGEPAADGEAADAADAGGDDLAAQIVAATGTHDAGAAGGRSDGASRGTDVEGSADPAGSGPAAATRDDEPMVVFEDAEPVGAVNDGEPSPGAARGPGSSS